MKSEKGSEREFQEAVLVLKNASNNDKYVNKRKRMIILRSGFLTALAGGILASGKNVTPNQPLDALPFATFVGSMGIVKGIKDWVDLKKMKTGEYYQENSPKDVINAARKAEKYATSPSEAGTGRAM